MKVCSVAQMRALDKQAIEQFGIKEELLMENAGEALYFVLATQVGIPAKRFVVLCGSGNNGGDGFVVARKLHSAGARVKVFVLGDPAKYKAAAALNLDIVSRLPLDLKQVHSLDDLKKDLFHCDVIVDALFGTGLGRNVEGLYREVIGAVNQSGKTVISADIASGVQGDTGQIMGIAVEAHYTVSFGLPKLGNLLYPGFKHCGKQYVTHISFPPQMMKSVPFSINVPIALPARNPQGHKGMFGDVLFVAGASSYLGAPYFSALSFLKAGGGYARLAGPRRILPFVAANAPELVLVPAQETAAGNMAADNAQGLQELAERSDMVVLGPGLSLDDESQALARSLVSGIKKPLLLDGDGLSAVCSNLDIVRQRKGATIVTPHPGEMARLTGMPAADIDADKVNVVQRTAADLNAIVVLKGPHSLIGYPDGKALINLSGNAGMATAGSGDVLTGTIAAMFGLGLRLEQAVAMGVFVHGLSGDVAARALGQDGITARDILEALPASVKMLRDGLDKDLRQRYWGPRLI